MKRVRAFALMPLVGAVSPLLLWGLLTLLFSWDSVKNRAEVDAVLDGGDERGGWIGSDSRRFDANGEALATLKFDGVDSFSDGMARVLVAGRYGFIDRSGALVIPARFTWAGSFHGGFAPVRSAEGWEWVNRSGEAVLGKIGEASAQIDG